jgi:TRAP-type uncharacterized transport system fused permease subunit
MGSTSSIQFHPVDIVVNAVGFVVGQAISQRCMQDQTNWFLWVVIIAGMLCAAHDARSTLKPTAWQLAGVSPGVRQVASNMADTLVRIFVWSVIDTLRTLVNWMLEPGKGTESTAWDSLIAFLFLLMLIVSMFSTVEVLGLGRPKPVEESSSPVAPVN